MEVLTSRVSVHGTGGPIGHGQPTQQPQAIKDRGPQDRTDEEKRDNRAYLHRASAHGYRARRQRVDKVSHWSLRATHR